MGRVEADLSSWMEYFCLGMANAFENVYQQTKNETPGFSENKRVSLRHLDTRQKRVLELFQKSDTITANDVSKLFGIQPRMARVLCQKWMQLGFIKVTDSANKNRKYCLTTEYEGLLNL